MKYIKCLVSVAVVMSTLQAFAATEGDPSFARGLMIAVDTRDHAACQLVQERVNTMAPSLKADICEQDSLNPLSIIVMTVPITEWDFTTEVDLSRNAPTTVRDRNIGFVQGGSAGILFLIPYSRESDSNLRMSLKQKALKAAHVRVADLSLLEEQQNSSISISFILKRTPNRSMSGERQQIAERMAKRVLITKNFNDGADKDKDKDASALASLNIMDSINTSIQTAANSKNFEIDVYLPEAPCSKTVCSNKSDSILPPLGLGFSFTVHF